MNDTYKRYRKYKRGPYIGKKQTLHDLARYFLEQDCEREALVKNLKNMTFDSRPPMRRIVEQTLWYRACSVLYGRPVARQLTTILIDEVLK